MQRISSAQNPTLKLARKLMKSSRERERSGRILLDGVHLISEYVARIGLSGADVLVDEAATLTPEIDTLIQSLPADAKLFEVTSNAFAGISPVDTPSGIVALCNRPRATNLAKQISFGLLLDGVQDPGNLGSVLRTAAATGVDVVFLSGNCADAWSPRALRGGMGAQFILPIISGVDAAETVRNFAGRCIATSSHNGVSLLDADLSGPLLAMFGGEGAGLPEKLSAAADVTLQIPLKNEIESLNIGAAAAMFCYERVRQVSR